VCTDVTAAVEVIEAPPLTGTCATMSLATTAITDIKRRGPGRRASASHASCCM